MSDDTQLIFETIERIKPLLAGKPPPIQGAVLAELLALWISHHYMVDADGQEQQQMWEDLLQMHVEHVRMLIIAGEADKGGGLN